MKWWGLIIRKDELTSEDTMVAVIPSETLPSMFDFKVKTFSWHTYKIAELNITERQEAAA